MLWNKQSSKTKDRRAEANRANAQKSTGPTSPEGKARSSQNRTVHGLTGAFRVLEGESQEKFDALVDQLILDEQPVGIAEIELVKKMAEHMWLSERASRFQEACFLVMPQTPDQIENVEAEIRVRPELERYTRYQAHHDCAYARASAELLKRKKERRLAESGFESQQRAARVAELRESREDRQVERHLAAVALDKKHLELAEIKVFAASAAAGSRFEGLQPPQNAKIAA